MSNIRNGTEVKYKYANGKEIIELDIYESLETINEFLCSVQKDKLLNGNQIKMLIKYNATIADFTNSFFSLCKETLEKSN